MDHKSTKAAEFLDKARKLHEERNTTYGSAYKKHGPILKAFFPEGLALTGPLDFSRFALFNMIVSKLARYANNFAVPHHDSTEDTIAYVAMLREVDEDVLSFRGIPVVGPVPDPVADISRSVDGIDALWNDLDKAREALLDPRIRAKAAPVEPSEHNAGADIGISELDGKKLECACRRSARYGSLPNKKCRQCRGSGYVIVKDWKKNPPEDSEG